MEREIPLIDSSVWVALFHETDSQHTRAQKTFSVLNDSPIAIHEYVILEVCTVLQMKASKTVAKRFLETILDNEDIQVVYGSGDVLLEAQKVFSGQAGSLSLVDCVLAICSKTNPVLTFDTKLKNFITKG